MEGWDLERVSEVGKVDWDQLRETKRDYFVQVRADRAGVVADVV